MEGIIDCIENNFANFFPKEIRKQVWLLDFTCSLGQYIGFYHHNHDLLDVNVIESFKRKFIRFDEKVKKNNCIFLRTIVRDNYSDEIKQYKKFQDVIDKKYPGISYVICFIIPNQNVSQYYKHLDNRTFLFTTNYKNPYNSNIKNQYKPIFDFIINNDLFNIIPNPNNIEINNEPSGLWHVNGLPMVNHIEN
jgi:hypothetical protein